MKIKWGVILDALQTPMIDALPVINRAFARQGAEMTITGGLEFAPGRVKNTLHPKGLALDFRSRGLPDYVIKKIVVEIKTTLGGDYDVVIGKNNLHVEFDPKPKGK